MQPQELKSESQLTLAFPSQEDDEAAKFDAMLDQFVDNEEEEDSSTTTNGKDRKGGNNPLIDPAYNPLTPGNYFEKWSANRYPKFPNNPKRYFVTSNFAASFNLGGDASNGLTRQNSLFYIENYFRKTHGERAYEFIETKTTVNVIKLTIKMPNVYDTIGDDEEGRGEGEADGRGQFYAWLTETFRDSTIYSPTIKIAKHIPEVKKSSKKLKNKSNISILRCREECLFVAQYFINEIRNALGAGNVGTNATVSGSGSGSDINTNTDPKEQKSQHRQQRKSAADPIKEIKPWNFKIESYLVSYNPKNKLYTEKEKKDEIEPPEWIEGKTGRELELLEEVKETLNTDDNDSIMQQGITTRNLAVLNDYIKDKENGLASKYQFEFEQTKPEFDNGTYNCKYPPSKYKYHVIISCNITRNGLITIRTTLKLEFIRIWIEYLVNLCETFCNKEITLKTGTVGALLENFPGWPIGSSSSGPIVVPIVSIPPIDDVSGLGGSGSASASEIKSEIKIAGSFSPLSLADAENIVPFFNQDEELFPPPVGLPGRKRSLGRVSRETQDRLDKRKHQSLLPFGIYGSTSSTLVPSSTIASTIPSNSSLSFELSSSSSSFSTSLPPSISIQSTTLESAVTTTAETKATGDIEILTAIDFDFDFGNRTSLDENLPTNALLNDDEEDEEDEENEANGEDQENNGDQGDQGDGKEKKSASETQPELNVNTASPAKIRHFQTSEFDRVMQLTSTQKATTPEFLLNS